MAILEKKYDVGIRDVGTDNAITNHGILSLLEDIACLHSDKAGYGINQMEQTHLSWVLLHWKVCVLRRTSYQSTVTVKTWARCANRFFTLRDFEIYDEDGNLMCIATSKWALVNTKTGGLSKIEQEIIDCYNPEEKNVFDECVNDIAKLKILELPNSPTYTFTVQRRDIDINKHMHNLYYLDYAYETLPQKIYEKHEANEFEIMYKSGAKLGNLVSCFYVEHEDSHNIVMKGENNQLHAIVKLKF